jgi:hypothetical protein
MTQLNELIDDRDKFHSTIEELIEKLEACTLRIKNLDDRMEMNLSNFLRLAMLINLFVIAFVIGAGSVDNDG